MCGGREEDDEEEEEDDDDDDFELRFFISSSTTRGSMYAFISRKNGNDTYDVIFILRSFMKS